MMNCAVEPAGGISSCLRFPSERAAGIGLSAATWPLLRGFFVAAALQVDASSPGRSSA